MPRAKKGKAGEALVTPTGGKVDLRRIIGAPLVPEPEVPESADDRIEKLKRRLLEVANPPENPYQANFWKFLTTMVYTKAEAIGGEVKQAPDWPYLRDLADDLVEEQHLFIEKSRRVFASWCVCAFDIWVAAGGQDRRWPVLMNSRENRQVYVVGRMFEHSCYYLERRIKFIIDQIDQRDLRRYWPDFPDFHWKEGEARLSNGSFINALAHGPDVSRGAEGTVFHLEELATWEKAAETVQAIIPTLHGGGHLVAICTPKANTYAEKISAGKLATG